MTQTQDFSGYIVVATDGSPTAQGAVDWAGLHASRSGRKLAVMMVLPTMPTFTRAGILHDISQGMTPEEFLNNAERKAQAKLLSAVESQQKAHPDLVVEAITEQGEASYPIARASETADLVVVGARGDSAPFRTRTIGGTADAVTTHAKGPVVVVPQSMDYDPKGPIVVGYDGSPESQEAVKVAIREAIHMGVEVEFLQTWDMGGWSSYGASGWGVNEDDMAKELKAAAMEFVEPQLKGTTLKVRYIIRPGHPAEELIVRSERASMTVIGSRGRGGFKGLLLGSVSRIVLRGAKSPVLVTRAAREGK